MRRLLLLLCLFAGCLAAVPALAGGDVLKNYKSRFEKDAFLSEREAVISELTGSKSAKGLAALRYCVDLSKKEMGKLLAEADKLRGKLGPVTKKYQEKYSKYADQQAKQGNPNPKTHPRWPIALELRKLEADVEYAEKRAGEWRSLVELAREGHGTLVASLPEAEQTKLREKWERGPLADRDWAVRADQWDLIGRIPTAWAFEMIQRAVAAEPDPRVLVHIIDGFAGRDPALVTPVLIGLFSDVRWVVRASAVAALEKTPSKEGVDAIVALMQAEDGRIVDDCARALSALTGQQFGTQPATWKNWWAANRDAWTGPVRY